MKLVKLFTTPSCGYCKPMKLSLIDLLDEDGEFRLKLVSLDESKDEFLKYGVMAVPTIIVETDGEEVDRHIGSMTKHELGEFIGRSLQRDVLPESS